MNDKKMQIRSAEETDSKVLSEIAYRAKSHWKYPEEYMDIWKNELTITKEYIDGNIVNVIIIDNKIVGFYSIVYIPEPKWFGKVYVDKGNWLDHMFILPEYHKRGLGTLMFNDLKKTVSGKIKIFVDPNAIGFYIKQGAIQIGVSESSIPGRMIPVFEYSIK